MINYNKENCCFKKLTGCRKRNLRKKVRRRKAKEKQRTWTAGRLITIDGKVYRMRSLYRYKCIQFHRCVFCATMNHFRPCGYCKSEACTKCMRKSDLSCFPLRIR